MNEQFLSKRTDGGLAEDVVVDVIVLAWGNPPSHQLGWWILFSVLLVSPIWFYAIPYLLHGLQCQRSLKIMIYG